MKKTIIVSGVNLSEGGPLTVIKSVLQYLDKSILATNFRIVALIHSKELFKNLENIELMEFPEVKSSWKNRIKFEYFECESLSKQLNSHLWLSLHDMTPNVISEKRAVYCHNASPFYKQNPIEFFKNPARFLYTKFYKHLYRINIHKNDYVIVQQKWIKDAFVRFFNLKKENVIISLPNEKNDSLQNIVPAQIKNDVFTFFYPAFPREFKNFEVICKAVDILKSEGHENFKVKLTIDGSENSYSNNIVKQFVNNKHLDFTGLLSKEQVEVIYSQTDCLIFPSKLETWGLPISEFKNYQKPMLVADLPYAHETVGDYEKVRYFNVMNEQELAENMADIMSGTIQYTNKGEIKYDNPICRNWEQLFKILLK